MTIGPELQAASVMPAREPGDDRRLARWVDGRRFRVVDPKPGDVRPVLQVGPFDIADVAVSVLLEVGVEGEGENLLEAGDLLGQVHDEVGGLDVRATGERVNLARELDDEESVAAGAQVRSRHSSNLSEGKTRSVTKGSGGSGDPWTRDVFQGVRSAMPTAGGSARATRPDGLRHERARIVKEETSRRLVLVGIRKIPSTWSEQWRANSPAGASGGRITSPRLSPNEPIEATWRAATTPEAATYPGFPRSHAPRGDASGTLRVPSVPPATRTTRSVEDGIPTRSVGTRRGGGPVEIGEGSHNCRPRADPGNVADRDGPADPHSLGPGHGKVTSHIFARRASRPGPRREG